MRCSSAPNLNRRSLPAVSFVRKETVITWLENQK